MAYVRRRGNQLAIVHGRRHPETRKVEQQVLFTLYSRPEALEVLGRGEPGNPAIFEAWLRRRYPDIPFNWSRIRQGIEKHMEVLPESHDYFTTRLRGRFREHLKQFARQLLLADPQELTASWRLIDQHRGELEFLRDLIDWRLRIPRPSPERAEWMADNPFHWRHALSGREVPPEAEEFGSNYFEKGELERAEAVFALLVESFDHYAEGWNYLGLIALERENHELAIAHFLKAVETGRENLPRRVAKRNWWTVLETRPYMRGLRNLASAYNQAQRHDEALHICERLKMECADGEIAATHAAAAHLCLGSWQLTLDHALHVHRLWPQESLIAALAAFELGRHRDAGVWSLHTILNAPHAAAMVLDLPMPRPGCAREAEGHNAGVGMYRAARGFLERQSTASKHFFRNVWRGSARWREELDAARREWETSKDTADRTAFHRFQEMSSLAFAERAWSRLCPFPGGPNGHPATN